MSLMNVNNVLAGLGDYGIDTTRVYKDLERECGGESEEALADYLQGPPLSLEFDFGGSSIIVENKYPGSM